MDDDTVAWDPHELDEDGPAGLPVNRPDTAWSQTDFDVEEIDHAIDGIKEGKVPEPALIRGLIVAAFGILATIFKLSVDQEVVQAVVDAIIGIYVLVGPVVLAWWIRRNVTPVKK